MCLYACVSGPAWLGTYRHIVIDVVSASKRQVKIKRIKCFCVNPSAATEGEHSDSAYSDVISISLYFVQIFVHFANKLTATIEIS